MFRNASFLPAFLAAHAAPLLLTGASLVFVHTAFAQQLGRTWHKEPAHTVQMGPLFDATSKVGLAGSATLKVANWAFFLENQTVHHYDDGPGEFMYHSVDRVADVRMSVVRTQSGTAVPANFVAVDLDFMGQRVVTRRSSAATPGAVSYRTLLSVSRDRETSGMDSRDITGTWTGTFEISASGTWSLSPTALYFEAQAEARLRQASEYFWGSNRNMLGIGATREIWGGYSPVTMRASASLTLAGPSGSSVLWTDGCELRTRDRSYTIFQIPDGSERNERYWFTNLFEHMM